MAKLASSTTTTQTMAWQRPRQQAPLDHSEWVSLKEAAKVRKNGSNKADVPRDVLLELELSRPLLALRKSVAEEAAAKGAVWALKAERKAKNKEGRKRNAARRREVEAEEEARRTAKAEKRAEAAAEAKAREKARQVAEVEARRAAEKAARREAILRRVVRIVRSRGGGDAERGGGDAEESAGVGPEGSLLQNTSASHLPMSTPAMAARVRSGVAVAGHVVEPANDLLLAHADRASDRNDRMAMQSSRRPRKRVSVRDQALAALEAAGEGSQELNQPKAPPKGSRLNRGAAEQHGTTLEAISQRSNSLGGHKAYRETSKVVAELPRGAINVAAKPKRADYPEGPSGEEAWSAAFNAWERDNIGGKVRQQRTDATYESTVGKLNSWLVDNGHPAFAVWKEESVRPRVLTQVKVSPKQI